LNKSLYIELNHRVKNNLQLISGLFAMQTYTIEDQAIQNVLKNVRNKIEVIANLHRNLYETSIATPLDADVYLHEIIKSTKLQLSAQYNTVVEINANALPLKTSFDTCIDLGLLLNELLAIVIETHIKSISKSNITINFSSVGSLLTGEIYFKQTCESGSQPTEAASSSRLTQLLLKQNNGSIIWSYASDEPTIFTMDLSI